jgi:nucleoside-diphosphate-sugar epimerase
MLVPSAIRALQEGKRPHLREPKQIRDFLYEKDFASAVLAVLNSEWTQEPIFNVGSGKSITVQEFVDELSKRLDLEDQGVQAQMPLQHNQRPTIEMDISLIEQKIGWSPKFDYKSAIEDLAKGLRA